MFKHRDRYDILVSGLFQLISYEYLENNGGVALHFSLEHNSSLPRTVKELAFEKALQTLPLTLIYRDTNLFDLFEPGEFYSINFLRTVRKDEK